MKIKLQMIQEDIDGATVNGQNCPIARTINRTLGGKSSVFLRSAYVNGEHYELDEAGINFVDRLCKRLELAPIEVGLSKIKASWSVYVNYPK